MRSQQESRNRRQNTFLLSAMTTIGLFLVNVFGFIDTETGSALGCGHEWPLCQGGIFPTTWGVRTIIEYGHRVFVFVIAMLLFVTVIVAWRRFKAWLEIRILIGISVGCVLLESAFGALGVLFADPPALLAVHLGVAILAFAASLLMTFIIRQVERSPEHVAAVGLRPQQANVVFRRWTWVTIIYTYFAMYYGAYVANTGDGGLFRGWPFPTEHYAVAHGSLIVDIVHRTIALGLLLLITRLLMYGYQTRSIRPDLFRATVVAMVLVCLQAFSGAYLIFTHLSTPAFLTHVSIVGLLFATLCYLLMQMLPNRLPIIVSKKPSIGRSRSADIKM